jgi:hypothetical protein
MDACLTRLLLAVAAMGMAAAAPRAQVYQYATRNFLVTAPTAETAHQVADAAEHYRKELAKAWLGRELPPWSARCPIKVNVGQLGAGGSTTFTFHPSATGPAEVTGWKMQIQGSLERILDSVLPHEISHTIFACHFRRPLPRWADEGAATLAEHESEKRRQILTLRQVMGTRRRMPLRQLLGIREYPSAMQDLLTLYAEGYSLAELLVQEKGKERYLRFLADAHVAGWDQALRENYGYQSIEVLEERWQKWIMAGSPEINADNGVLVAAYAPASSERRPAARQTGAANAVVRGQSPDRDEQAKQQAAPATPELPGPLEAPSPRRKTEAPVAMQTAMDDEDLIELALAAESQAERVPMALPARNERNLPASAPMTKRVTWSEFPADPRPSVLVFRHRR